VAEEGEGGDAAVLPEVPPRDVARSEEEGKKQGTDKQWTKIFICLATSLGQ
jgi:hypothetical protein